MSILIMFDRIWVQVQIYTVQLLHMIPAVTLNHCALMYQNLLTYPISNAWSLSAFCDLFYFVSWIRFIQNERVIFLS